ncbi:MAG: hypothetical protein V4574_12740 [Pseudomonadota bacterium]
MPTILSFALFAAASAASPAELSPAYQRLAELRAITETPAVAAAFDGVPVDRVEYVSTDLYRVTAGRCRLEVRIVGLPVPEGVNGGRRFEVRAGVRVCG